MLNLNHQYHLKAVLFSGFFGVIAVVYSVVSEHSCLTIIGHKENNRESMFLSPQIKSLTMLLEVRFNMLLSLNCFFFFS